MKWTLVGLEFNSPVNNNQGHVDILDSLIVKWTLVGLEFKSPVNNNQGHVNILDSLIDSEMDVGWFGV